ncbi:MAG: TVP38/TMEM64 family protein [Gemmatimonadetes bacterium]|nr:TVP38/TMEM64 family protein [Gemmatimonadota bacterium]
MMTRAVRVVAIVAVVAGLVALGRVFGDRLPVFVEWVRGQGALAPVVFVAGYAAAVVVLVPGSLLTLAAGAIFGLRDGVAIVFVGAVAGASAAFLIARHLVRRPFERRLAGDARFAAIDQAVSREGRKIVFLLRLSPIFPFSLLNYGLGLTQVRFADYVAASIGMLPGTFLYVYYGKLAGDVASLAAGAATPKGTGYWLVLGLGLAATVAVTVLITRLARRALASEAGVS